MLTTYGQCPGHCAVETSHGPAVTTAKQQAMGREKAWKIRGGVEEGELGGWDI